MEENHENSRIVCVRKEMRCKYDPEDLCSGAPDPLGVSADRDDREFRNETGINACPAAGLMIR